MHTVLLILLDSDADHPHARFSPVLADRNRPTASSLLLHPRGCLLVLLVESPRWGTADAEIKGPHPLAGEEPKVIKGFLFPKVGV